MHDTPHRRSSTGSGNDWAKKKRIPSCWWRGFGGKRRAEGFYRFSDNFIRYALCFFYTGAVSSQSMMTKCLMSVIFPERLFSKTALTRAPTFTLDSSVISTKCWRAVSAPSRVIKA